MSAIPDYGGLLGVATGFGKEVLRRGEALANFPVDVAHRLTGGRPQERGTAGLMPSTPAQEVGAMGERAAEFALAGAGAAGLVRGASLPVQSLAQGVAAGGTSAAQGGDGGDVALASALGAAGPPLAATVKAGAEFIARRMTARQINSVLGVRPGALRNADDLGPGKRLAEDGVRAPTREGVLRVVQDNLDDAGRQIDDVVRGSDQVFDAVDDTVLRTYDDVQTSRLRPREVRQMDRDFEWISSQLPDRPMTATELQAFHTSLGKQIKWTGKAAQREANQVMRDLYFKINDMIETRIPGMKGLYSRWRDYFIAKEALDPAIRKIQTSPPVSGTAMGTLQRATRAAPSTYPAVLLQRATQPSTVDSMIQATRAARSGLLAERTGR